MLILPHPVRQATALAVLLSSTVFAASAYAVTSNAPPSAGPPSTSVMIDSEGNARVSPDVNTPAGNTVRDMQASPAMRSNNDAMAAHHDKEYREHMRLTPEQRRERVESRITTLHDKLGITKDQEPAWSDVAQAMRDNEASMSTLIHERHANAKTMNAVDDLRSYQRIAQAHADGLKRVTAAFENLYNDMPDVQKRNADKVFDGSEGHRMLRKGMKGKK